MAEIRQIKNKIDVVMPDMIKRRVEAANTIKAYTTALLNMAERFLAILAQIHPFHRPQKEIATEIEAVAGPHTRTPSSLMELERMQSGLNVKGFKTLTLNIQNFF